MDNDLSYIKPAEHTKNFRISIKPVSAVSMQSGSGMTFTGAYITPPLSVLYGMLESILGIWTMSTVDGPKVRNRIRDEAGVSSPVANPSKAYKAGTIIHDALSFVSVVTPKHKIFTDLRRRHMRGETVFHWNGTNNKDISLAAAYGPPKPETNPEFYKSVQNKTFSDETRSRLPQYYGSPGLFEWVLYDGEIVCECTATEAMYDRLRVAVTARPAAYLGNSESSVIIKINEA